MAKREKERTKLFYVINIKLRDTENRKDVPISEYKALFKRLFKKKIHSKSSNQKHCIIQNQFEDKDDGTYLYGVLTQFTYIENKSWIDLSQMDVESDFQTPEDLFPDPKRTHYIFVPSIHRFAYIVDSSFQANPYTIKKFLELALDKVLPENRYVDVNVESDKSTLDKIKGALRIKRLKIDVNYSNTGLRTDAEKFFEEEMKKTDVARTELIATAKIGKSIDLKNNIILLGAAESSISNGETEAKVVTTEGNTETINTEKFPLKPKVTGLSARILDLMHNKLLSIFKNAN